MRKTGNLPLHDLHLHTRLSLCSNDANATPEAYLTLAEKAGHRVIGISDHVWDERVPLALPGFYRHQPVSRQLAGMPALFSAKTRLLWGCETEFAGGMVGIHPETAAMLDFVLVPHSHLHMEGFVRPAYVRTPKELAAFMAKTFWEVANTGIATVIAHPFDPCMCYEQIQEIGKYLSDGRLEDCFGLAAEKGTGVEINIGSLRGEGPGQPVWEYHMRILACAKRMGCKFSFGSDAHSLRAFSDLNQEIMDRIADTLKLERSDLIPLLVEMEPEMAM